MRFAVFVGQNLNFNVPGLFDVFLDVDRSVAKCLGSFVARRAEFFLERHGVVGHAHAPPTAAGNSLNENRIPNLLSHVDRFLSTFDDARATGHGGHADTAGPSRGARALSPMRRILREWGPMNLMLHSSHCSANSGSSEKETVTGVNAVDRRRSQRLR